MAGKGRVRSTELTNAPVDLASVFGGDVDDALLNGRRQQERLALL
jgi:hypothetical protein